LLSMSISQAGKANSFEKLNPAPPQIEGRVWHDDDANGIQDAGEVGISGITVELLDAGGSVSDSKITEPDG